MQLAALQIGYPFIYSGGFYCCCSQRLLPASLFCDDTRLISKRRAKTWLGTKKIFFYGSLPYIYYRNIYFHGNHVFSKEGGVIIRIERGMCCLQSMGGGNIKEINGDILTN